MNTPKQRPVLQPDGTLKPAVPANEDPRDGEEAIETLEQMAIVLAEHGIEDPPDASTLVWLLRERENARSEGAEQALRVAASRAYAARIRHHHAVSQWLYTLADEEQGQRERAAKKARLGGSHA